MNQATTGPDVDQSDCLVGTTRCIINNSKAGSKLSTDVAHGPLVE